jgi:hypothetical protein
METSSAGSGVLVTGTNAEQQPPQERLVKQRWELSYAPDEWQALSRDEREAFLLKDTLAVVILDVDRCLARNVRSNYAESDTQRVLR